MQQLEGQAVGAIFRARSTTASPPMTVPLMVLSPGGVQVASSWSMDRMAGRSPAPERLLDRIVAPLSFRVVFSMPDTDETYARTLVADLFNDPSRPQG
ncbi:hypothetical protein [Streptomyces broussonetiae]|uniref:hypothetical protein n=1 Tax=Streptomyces broussonetiae TaxID=2686304 RepID=UPI004063EB45